MRGISKLRLRLRSLLQRRRVEAELDEELRFHLERLTDEHVAAGLAPEEARYAALREMGGLEQRKEECREARGLALFDELRQDARYALRGLRKSPGFTTVALLSLGLGIGANTTIFSFVNAVLLKPLPYPGSDRLVVLREQKAGSARTVGVHPLNFLEWSARSRSFEALALVATPPLTVIGPSGAEQITRVQTTAELFRAFVVRATGDTSAQASAIRRAIQEVDPTQGVSAVRTMEQYVGDSLARPRLYAVLVASFAVLAVLLAAIGIYGLIAYVVTQRTHEIGIRLALGASRGDVFRALFGQGAALTFAGLILGVGAALGLRRVVAALLFGVTPSDPASYVLAAALFAAVALAVAAIPAHRASRVDPTTALRDE
jgi:hypothetical protein